MTTTTQNLSYVTMAGIASESEREMPSTLVSKKLKQTEARIENQPTLCSTARAHPMFYIYLTFRVS